MQDMHRFLLLTSAKRTNKTQKCIKNRHGLSEQKLKHEVSMTKRNENLQSCYSMFKRTIVVQFIDYRVLIFCGR